MMCGPPGFPRGVQGMLKVTKATGKDAAGPSAALLADEATPLQGMLTRRSRSPSPAL